jgi:hypothetical protein
MDMKETLAETVARWATMSFKENPYGEPIPRKYLYDFRVMDPKSKKRTLSECMQDGNVMDYIFNDKSKMSAAEKEETVQFSDVFHRLEIKGTLCPSNYIVEVIHDLEKWDKENNTRHNDDFYCKTIARSLRTFASMLRENNLREIIDAYMRTEAIRRGRVYKMFDANVQEDVNHKTDIAIKFAGTLYRIWSYQVTESGVKKTSKRIEKGAGYGYNVLLPFDLEDAEYVHGWAFYPVEYVENAMSEFVIARKFWVQTHADYKKQVKANREIIKVPAIFSMP